MPLRTAVLIAFLSAPATADANTPRSGDCSRWIGDYVGSLSAQDTYLGLPSELRLSVSEHGIEWSVTGESIPEMMLAALRYRCTTKGIYGSFSGSSLIGTFKLTKAGYVYWFDASKVGNERGTELNFIGYAPNRAVSLNKAAN